MDPAELFNVRGKVALVTGGSRGIGEVAAETLVRGGARVYITARKAEACHATAERLSALGECVSLPHDLSRLDEVEAIASEIEAKESRLDLLINNAGAAWAEPLGSYSESGWDKVMDLNVKSVFFLTQRLLPLLRAAADPVDPPRVINIGSVDGIGVPLTDSFAYAAAKSGLHHLTKMLAHRLAPENIIVNAIAPGPFSTRMMAHTLAHRGEEIVAAVPRGRIGSDEDIAGVTLFLCSRASAYITGVVLPLDGGLTGAAGH